MSTYAIGPIRRRRATAPITARQTLAGLIVAGVAAALTVYVAGRGAKGVAILIVSAGVLWFVSTRRTGVALAVLALYLGLVDGYLKLKTGSNLVTFVRDALLYAIVIGVLVRAAVQGRRLTAPPLTGWVVAFVVLVLVQVANPHGGTLYHSLAGVRQHLEFVPLFFLTFAYVRTTEALRTVVLLLVAIAVANGVVDYIQFHLTPGQLAGWGSGYAERVLGTGAFRFSGRNFYAATGVLETRPFGLMSDAGSGGLACAMAIGGVMALVSLPSRRRYVPVAILAGVLAVVGLLTSQSRASVVAGVVVALAFTLLTFTSKRALTTVVVVAVAGLVALVTIRVVESSQSKVFRYNGVSTTQIVSTTAKARGKSIDLIPHTLAAHPLGDGLGVAGPATGAGGAPPQAGTIDAETEFSFATLEAGIPGMATLVGFTLVLFVLAVARCRREPDPEARVLLAALLAPLGAMLALYWVAAITPTTPFGPYLWAAGGIVSYWLVVRPAELRRQADALLATI